MFWSDAALYRGEPLNVFGTGQLAKHIASWYGPFQIPVHGRVTFLTKNYPRHCYRVFGEPEQDVSDWCRDNLQTRYCTRHETCWDPSKSHTDVIFEHIPTKKEQMHFKLRWG
jgi:hypothetical protein